MGVTTTKTNKPINPRGNDQSPKGYNRASLFSGKALDFDGVNDNVDLDGFTLSGTAATICFNGLVTGSNRYFFWVGGKNYGIINHDTLGFGIFDSATWNYFGTTQRSEMNSYCVVNEGTTQRVYCNGVQIGSDATATAIDWSSPSKVLLGSNNAENEFLNGQLSGFKIFNTALTAAQVADLYNNPEKVVPTGVDNTALKLWLPMMEGAGTTAYDGSGNGNHGTISGATYVNGIGAPVAQSAVMDWNKGTNKLPDSSDLENATHWPLSIGITIEAGYTAPDGTNTAFKVSGTNNLTDDLVTEADDYRAIWARTTSGTGTAQLLSHNSNTNNIFNITEEWQKFSVDSSNSTGAANFYAVDFRGSGTLSEVVLWQPHCAESESVLVPTIGTTQTSDVLLPQGLTTGRDITGVNLFENVRKQGALNLDGNSWAEVHDNESLDFGSGSWTLEAWAYVETTYNGKGIISRWYSASQGPMMWAYNGNFQVYQGQNSGAGSTAISTPIPSNGWHHIVGTFDSNDNFIRVYLNGVLKNTSGTITNPYGSNTLPLEIGRINNDTSTEYSNDIAQPRIYNRALTASEIQQNYNAGKNTYTN